MKKNSRQNKTRFKLKKVTSRNRLSVFKSNNHVYAQIISDQKGITIASASSLEKNFITEKLTRKEHGIIIVKLKYQKYVTVQGISVILFRLFCYSRGLEKISFHNLRHFLC